MIGWKESQRSILPKIDRIICRPRYDRQAEEFCPFAMMIYTYKISAGSVNSEIEGIGENQSSEMNHNASELEVTKPGLARYEHLSRQ